MVARMMEVFGATLESHSLRDSIAVGNCIVCVCVYLYILRYRHSLLAPFGLVRSEKGYWLILQLVRSEITFESGSDVLLQRRTCFARCDKQRLSAVCGKSSGYTNEQTWAH
jgi:hypothetical protein